MYIYVELCCEKTTNGNVLLFVFGVSVVEWYIILYILFVLLYYAVCCSSLNQLKSMKF